MKANEPYLNRLNSFPPASSEASPNPRVQDLVHVRASFVMMSASMPGVARRVVSMALLTDKLEAGRRCA